MSINKNWMVEDNFSLMAERSREKILYDFVADCLMAICVSCDSGRKLKQPGQAVSWYLSRMPDKEAADYIRKNLKPKHLNALWSEYTKLILMDNDERDRTEKYPRRGSRAPKEAFNR